MIIVVCIDYLHKVVSTVVNFTTLLNQPQTIFRYTCFLIGYYVSENKNRSKIYCGVTFWVHGGKNLLILQVWRQRTFSVMIENFSVRFIIIFGQFTENFE